MLGLENLGVSHRWVFRFDRPGKTLEALPGQVYADIGNKLCPGVIDTHFGTPYESTTAAIADNPHLVTAHLLGDLVRRVARGGAPGRNTIPFCFGTHTKPDWDAVSAFYLCDYLVRHGQLPERKVLDWIVSAANQVDQARVEIGGEVARVFLVCRALGGVEEERPFSEWLEKGYSLIETVLDHALNSGAALQPQGNPFLDPMDPSLARRYAREIEELREDLQTFVDEAREVSVVSVGPPRGRGGGASEQAEPVKALVFDEEPRSKLPDHWMYEQDRAALLAIPRRAEAAPEWDWIICLHPDKGRSLRRLGYCLELAEASARGEAADPRRPRGRYAQAPIEGAVRRQGAPRFGSPFYCDNEDPWYDGRSHGYRIVVSPRRGSVLGPEKIKSILLSRFHNLTASRATLAHYFFLELPEAGALPEQLEDGSECAWPLKEVSHAFGFAKQVALQVVDSEQDAGASWRLYWSDVTRHAVLEVEHVLPGPNLDLETVPATLDAGREEAARICGEVQKKLGLPPAALWGDEGYTRVNLVDPDFQNHVPHRIHRLLRSLCKNAPLDERVAADLATGAAGDALLATATNSACVVRSHSGPGADDDDTADFRSLLLYGLFLKTAYRRFSARLSEITKNIPRRPNVRNYRKMRRVGGALQRTLAVQADFARFLGECEFSERELSTDGRVQQQMRRVAAAVELAEQRRETNFEMELFGNVVNTIEGESRYRGETLTHRMLGVVGVLALGDFLYSWLSGAWPDLLGGPAEIGWWVLALLLVMGMGTWRILARGQLHDPEPASLESETTDGA